LASAPCTLLYFYPPLSFYSLPLSLGPHHPCALASPTPSQGVPCQPRLPHLPLFYPFLVLVLSSPHLCRTSPLRSRVRSHVYQYCPSSASQLRQSTRTPPAAGHPAPEHTRYLHDLSCASSWPRHLHRCVVHPTCAVVSWPPFASLVHVSLIFRLRRCVQLADVAIRLVLSPSSNTPRGQRGTCASSRAAHSRWRVLNGALYYHHIYLRRDAPPSPARICTYRPVHTPTLLSPRMCSTTSLSHTPSPPPYQTNHHSGRSWTLGQAK
jgi:hypothetical protein